MLQFTARSLLLIAVSATAVGCGAPCDRLCDTQADYIEFCMENGSQPDWNAAAAAGFGAWGYSSRDEYVAGCKDDFANQVSDDADDVITSECNDKDAHYGQLFDRGLCADVP